MPHCCNTKNKQKKKSYKKNPPKKIETMFHFFVFLFSIAFYHYSVKRLIIDNAKLVLALLLLVAFMFFLCFMSV